MRIEHHRVLIAALLCVLMTSGDAFGQEERVLSNITWQELTEAGELASGQVVADEVTGEQVLMVSHAGGGPGVFPVVEILDPGISTSNYAVRGQVRYEDVGGVGFVEMWNYFPDGSGYFSRTLDTGGAMEMISGDSQWREFVVPFFLSPDPEPSKPNRLVVNLVLPESGTVWISDLELIESDGPPNLILGGSGWWGDRTGGLIGGGIGGLMGILLGLAGTLIGIGRGRVFVTVILIGTAGVGAVCLITGFVALAAAQPYAVTYPLLLIGVLGLFFGVGGLPMSRMAYRQRELRQMQALDA